MKSFHEQTEASIARTTALYQNYLRSFLSWLRPGAQHTGLVCGISNVLYFTELIALKKPSTSNETFDLNPCKGYQTLDKPEPFHLKQTG